MTDDPKLRAAREEAILTDIMRTVVRDALNDWGQGIGLDTRNPMQQQADFQHLRRWRTVIEGGGMRVMITVVSMVITGLVAAIWLGITTALHR